MISPHYPWYFLRPSSFGPLKPPLQSSQQNSIRGLHLSVRLGCSTDANTYLMPTSLHTTSPIAGLRTEYCYPRPGASAHRNDTQCFSRQRLLYLVCSDLSHRFCFYPLREVLNSYYQVLHLPYRQRKRPQNVNSPSVERPWAVN